MSSANPDDSGLPLPRRIWWPWDEPVQRVEFERRFALPVAARATLFVTTSGDYAVSLDGRALERPASHAPSWRIIHEIALSLRAGEHVLSFEATPGPHGQPFLLACLDWEDSAGASQRGRVGTDGSWRMRTAPRGEWRAAWAFDGVWAEPWGMPCNVPDDFCRLTHGWQTVQTQKLTTAVELHAGLTAAGAAVRVLSDGVAEMRPARPPPPGPPTIGNVRKQDLAYRSREAHSHIVNHWLELFETRAPHVVLDVGAETFGRVRVRLRSGGPALIATTTGESLPEVHRHVGRVSDVFRLQDGESFATGPTGFRYVKLMVLSVGGADPVRIDPVEVQHIRYPVEPVGSFSCGDGVLTRIWQLAAQTVHLCMQNELWDGIKRDQLPWMGDLYTEALAVYHAFGDTRLARWSLGVLGELGPTPDRALTARRYPGLQSMWKRPGADINGIPSYTMWWVVGLADYLMYSGDRTLIEDLVPELAATLEHIASWVDDGGCWRHRAGWDYVDWAPLNADERAIFCHLLACQALARGADLLDAGGHAAGHFRAVRDRMVAYARRAIWCGGERNFGAVHHIPAMLIRSGVLAGAEAAAVFARALAGDPPFRMTYWHRYADLEAAACVGAVQWGLEYIRRHWGPALALGMTALWEAFDPAWLGDDPHAVSMIAGEFARYGGYETSLCHGWSAGPAVWLHRAVLGVSPTAPGFAAVRIAPELGDLQWAEGTVPTPRGRISVHLERGTAGAARALLRLPDDIAVEISPVVRERWTVECSVSAGG